MFVVGFPDSTANRAAIGLISWGGGLGGQCRWHIWQSHGVSGVVYVDFLCQVRVEMLLGSFDRVVKTRRKGEREKYTMLICGFSEEPMVAPRHAL